MKAGVALVHETGESLSSIVGQIGAIDANVRAIVESAREQAGGLAEINSAVTDMDQGTQKNAATVEESSAASHALASEISSLLEQLHQFDIGTPSANRTPVAHAPKPVVAVVRQLRTASSALRAGAAPESGGQPNWTEF